MVIAEIIPNGNAKNNLGPYSLAVCSRTIYFPFITSRYTFHHYLDKFIDIKEATKEQKEYFKLLHEDPD